ncbi:MAG: CAP domain-containing protein [Polyangiaceae bacterium]
MANHDCRWAIGVALCAHLAVGCAVDRPPGDTGGNPTTTTSHAGSGGGGGMGAAAGQGGAATVTATATTGSGTGGQGGESGGPSPQGCTASGLALIDEMNAYRQSQGLQTIPASSSLCIVSEHHVADLATNKPHAPSECNLHSWSDKGAWTACCYTSDHSLASCMWNKPKELSAYPGNGYEIAASGVSSAATAVNLWKTSPGHHAVMINDGIWANHPWKAVGAAIDGGFAVIWYGEQTDPMP